MPRDAEIPSQLRDDAYQLGSLWAQALKGRKEILVGSTPIGISPALIAMLAQIAAALIPVLLEKCNAKSIHKVALDGLGDRWMLRKLIIKEMGWIKFYWYGGQKLVDAAVRAAAHPHAPVLMGAFKK